jgi:broad specificity phosphatase PhoE
MLIVLRHGQTEANAAGRLLGRAESPLTDVGIAQARAAAAAIGPVDRVVSSPLRRARDTAACFGVDVEVDERWIELDYGDLDERPMRDVPADVWAAWRLDLTLTPGGGETLLALGTRVREACDQLARAAADSTVVVVTHVSPIKAAVAWALGVSDEVTWRMFVGVASATRIATTSNGPVLRSFNEDWYLRSPPA